MLEVSAKEKLVLLICILQTIVTLTLYVSQKPGLTAMCSLGKFLTAHNLKYIEETDILPGYNLSVVVEY